jgi:hypothetical protein
MTYTVTLSDSVIAAIKNACWRQPHVLNELSSAVPIPEAAPTLQVVAEDVPPHVVAALKDEGVLP